MNDRVGGTLARVKGLADNMLTALGQHLHRHVVGDHVPLNQCAQKLIFGFGRGREAHLDLLKPKLQ